MMLVACDPRRNPAVQDAAGHASQFRSSLVQLARAVGALELPAEDYTKKPHALQTYETCRRTPALTAGGEVVYV